ncbi:MAG: hypothetical protein EAZ60_13580 [Oscillatoriales cyanobacterium]|nr:MAG: hypothetical protein EAZ60_13580 [Oscillatoriales cyanobacterium]
MSAARLLRRYIAINLLFFDRDLSEVPEVPEETQNQDGISQVSLYRNRVFSSLYRNRVFSGQYFVTASRKGKKAGYLTLDA